MDYTVWGTSELIRELKRRDAQAEGDKGFFNCLRLHRDDFEMDGYDASKLTDQDMQWIADDIGEACMDSFWYAISHWATEKNLPKIIK